MLETLTRLDEPVRELRGVVNGTCNFILDLLARGQPLEPAIAAAQAEGYAEADPRRDLSGEDAADKLALLIAAAFGRWLAPEAIERRGLLEVQPVPGRCTRLIARARLEAGVLSARVAPETLPPGTYLADTPGAENRLEIELTSGTVLRLAGQGAGRWPTAAAVLGDLREIARSCELARTAEFPYVRSGT